MPDPSAQLHTLDEAASIMRMGRDFVRKLCKSGTIEATALGSGSQRKRWLISRGAIDDYLRQRTHRRDGEILAGVKMRLRAGGEFPQTSFSTADFARARKRLRLSR